MKQICVNCGQPWDGKTTAHACPPRVMTIGPNAGNAPATQPAEGRGATREDALALLERESMEHQRVQDGIASMRATYKHLASEDGPPCSPESKRLIGLVLDNLAAIVGETPPDIQVESPDGNPGWTSNDNAITMLAKLRAELSALRSLAPAAPGEAEETAQFFDRMAAAHHGELHDRYSLAARALRRPSEPTVTDEMVERAVAEYQRVARNGLGMKYGLLGPLPDINRHAVRAALKAALQESPK